jgi:hypothetical protein
MPLSLCAIAGHQCLPEYLPDALPGQPGLCNLPAWQTVHGHPGTGQGRVNLPLYRRRFLEPRQRFAPCRLTSRNRNLQFPYIYYKPDNPWSNFIFSTHIGVPFMFFDCANLMESVPG